MGSEIGGLQEMGTGVTFSWSGRSYISYSNPRLVAAVFQPFSQHKTR